jgi:hypothetical protein
MRRLSASHGNSPFHSIQAFAVALCSILDLLLRFIVKDLHFDVLSPRRRRKPTPI